MNSGKYHDITSGHLTILNPLSGEKLDEIIALMNLPAGARVLDMGCGKGEALIRVASKYSVTGIGVDLSSGFIEAARLSAARRVPDSSSVTFVQVRGEEYVPDAPFDAILCLGASWIFGGLKDTVAMLRKHLVPGGLMVIGEPHWRTPPDKAYLLRLEQMGQEADAVNTQLENVQVFQACGLTPLYSLVSSQDDYDRYEWNRVRAAEQYAEENPLDPDVPALVKRARTTRDLHLEFARDNVGWALYLLGNPRDVSPQR